MVCRCFKGDSRSGEAFKGIGQIPSRRVEGRNMIETGTGGGRGRAPLAFSGIEPDMVMVAASGEKHGALSVSLSYLEPKNPLIKSHGALKVGDLQVDMSDSDAGKDGRSRIY